MARHIRNAEDLLNFRGFKSPVFRDTDVTVRILFDDMWNNPSLMMNDTNGEPMLKDGKPMFVLEDKQIYRYVQGAISIAQLTAISSLLLLGLF